MLGDGKWYSTNQSIRVREKFEVIKEDAASADNVKSTLEVGKEDGKYAGKETSKDEVDIMVDAIQLQS